MNIEDIKQKKRKFRTAEETKFLNNQYQTAWRKANKEKFKGYTKKHRENNKEYWKSYHKNVKKHICEVCDYRCHTPFNLRRHMATRKHQLRCELAEK